MVNKLKPLLPSLKEKKRYIAFEVISKMRLNSNAVFDAIHVSALRFMGEHIAAKAGILILGDKWESTKQKGIIKINHKYTDHLRASLALIDRINNEQVIVRSLGSSGILRKATSKYLAA